MKKIFILILAAIPITACQRQSPDPAKEEKKEQPMAIETENIKIFVESNGEFLLDGNKSTLEELDIKLKLLKEKNGTVYYSRANPNEEPHEIAMQVMDLIANHSLPIAFYTDQTFQTRAKMD